LSVTVISSLIWFLLERRYTGYAVDIRNMNSQQILEELVALLEAGGVTIRQEPLGGSGGGLCSVKGKRIFFLDTQADSLASAELCAMALPKIMNVEQVYIKPEVRQFIENHYSE
jgi:hypothetical protein